MEPDRCTGILRTRVDLQKKTVRYSGKCPSSAAISGVSLERLKRCVLELDGCAEKLRTRSDPMPRGTDQTRCPEEPIRPDAQSRSQKGVNGPFDLKTYALVESFDHFKHEEQSECRPLFVISFGSVCAPTRIQLRVSLRSTPYPALDPSAL